MANISVYKDDPFPVIDGTEGTIQFVDDEGTIFVKSDEEISLGAVIEVNEYIIL